ncbi:MAG: J domain-containing protein [Methylobacter sp.]
MAKFRTHYDNLNVSRNAPLNVIKAAYKALCQKYHPDKYTGGHEQALRIMKAINGAYAVLSDSGKRVEHDQWIARQERFHANNEAQRIMEIITKNYVAPSVTAEKSYWTAISLCWKNVCIGVDNFWLGSSRILKKSRFFLWLIGACVLMFIGIILYKPDSKTSPVSVNQEIQGMLKKAAHLVKQGQAVKALPLYLLLAEHGNAVAQFYVGLLYAKGQGGIPKNDKQAVGWFGKAAQQGHREAQTKLCYMYAIGKGVAQSYISAIDWCYKAAKQGDVTAQYNLGLMYEKGQGVVKDNSLAFSWYGKAAAQGDARSQYNLGVIYANGLGVTKDTKQAAVWYRKAAKQGLPEAVDVLKQKIKD